MQVVSILSCVMCNCNCVLAGEKLTSNVTSCEAMTSRDRKKLLKIVWSQLSSLEGKIDEYMECAVVWLQFICMCVIVKCLLLLLLILNI